MRRGFVHAMAWTLATGAAVTLSWFGVQTVLSSTAYDPPAAMPIGDLTPQPQASSTQRSASPSASPTSSAPAESGSPSASPTGNDGSPSASPTPSDSTEATTPGTRVRSYSTQGGRVAFDLRADSASLVSATPTGGWQVQVWRNDQWIRVSFTRGDQTATVFCTWHDSAPRVQIDEHGE